MIIFPKADLTGMFPNYKGFLEAKHSGFVGTIQTGDLLGNPEKKIGNVNVYSNGGRLQPGCYTSESNIFECNSEFS